MKRGGIPSALQPGVSVEVPRGKQMGDVKQASVPVVVLGATIGGLAAAVAIRSRTGRAVCVVDVDGRETEANEGLEGQGETSCVFSARGLDAVRAVNPSLHRAVLAGIAKEAGAPAESATSSSDSPLRLSSSLLRELLISHLTAGAGGTSFLWCSSPLKHITLSPTAEGREGTQGNRSIVIVFEDGVVMKADLVVVATGEFSFLAQKDDPTCLEGMVPRPEGVGNGLGLLQGPHSPQGLDVAVLSDTEKQTADARCSASPRLTAEPTDEVKPAGLQQHVPELNVELLSAVCEGIKYTPQTVRSSSALKTAESSWSFWEGRLILIGAAVRLTSGRYLLKAHPWMSSLGNDLELDLEDAAQLGCSLYDWKFALRSASDRFQSIRKRRLASILRNSKMSIGWMDESPESSGGSTAAASPRAFFEDQMFVPTRDAYAELLPAAGLGYDVQEAEFCSTGASN